MYLAKSLEGFGNEDDYNTYSKALFDKGERKVYVGKQDADAALVLCCATQNITRSLDHPIRALLKNVISICSIRATHSRLTAHHSPLPTPHSILNTHHSILTTTHYSPLLPNPHHSSPLTTLLTTSFSPLTTPHSLPSLLTLPSQGDAESQYKELKSSKKFRCG